MIGVKASPELFRSVVSTLQRMEIGQPGIGRNLLPIRSPVGLSNASGLRRSFPVPSGKWRFSKSVGSPCLAGANYPDGLRRFSFFEY